MAVKTSSFAASAVLSDGGPTTLARLTVVSTPDTVSDYFIAAIKSQKQTPIARVDILDPSSRTVLRTITEDVDDGSVTVDVSRGTRRTFQLRVINENGEYTPSATNTSFAFNSLIRIYRGLRYTDSRGGETDEYCLIGTFMVDRPEVFVERNMSVLTVDGSDRWKVIATGGFPRPGRSFSAGTYINEIIRQVATDSGLTDDELNLDPLEGRATATKTLGSKLAWDVGDNRADFLLNLCEQYGLVIYFDVAGILTTREIVDPSKVTPMWTFTPGEDAVMLGVTKTQSDLKLSNHIIVSGENSQGVFTGARVDKEDDDPNSPTWVGGSMGDRILHFKAPLVFTQAQAQLVADKLFQENCLVEEEIKLPTICLPHLEGNDVIAITESTWAKVDDRYLAQRFDIPLREARMVIETKKGRALS